MFGLRVVTSTLLFFAAFGAATVAKSADDVTLRAELERVAQQRILFGHQSVGINLLEGLSELYVREGIPIHIVEVKNAGEVGPNMIGQTFLSENEHPLKKIISFEQAMGSKPTGLDIAIMKFCFVDFTANTDAKTLFDRYRATIEGLRTKNPGTTFVHITAPLHIVEGGLTARMKYFFGVAPLYGTYENMRREEYNALLRKEYQGREPFFDLARIESTTPDGATELVKWKGSVVPVMNPIYTNDGGHLNEVGKIRAARELVSVLSAIPYHKAVR